MRGDLQQRVPFLHGFVDQAELAVFEVADAAVDHVRGGARGALAVVAPFDQGDVDTLHGQVAERGDTVDAATHYQDLGSRALAQGGEL